MSCKVKSFYVVRSALPLCLSLQIFAGSLPEVFTIYTRWPSFLFNRVYVASVAWLPKCIGDYIDQFPKTRNCSTGARAIFLFPTSLACRQELFHPIIRVCTQATYVKLISVYFSFFRFVSFYSFFVMFGSIQFRVRSYHKQITVALQINGSAA